MDGWKLEAGEELVPGYLAWARLGAGKHTESWLAWSLVHQCAVVMKLPSPGQGSADKARRWLTREAQHLARLAHPGLPRLLSDELDGDPPHLLLEYVEGPTLASLIAEEGPFSPGDVVRVGLHLAAVLHYLHGAGVVHLDVKTSNVVLREGRPVLLDLGLARPPGSEPRGGRPVGTASAMAPEQARGEPAQPAMDLFGLGAVLYELAAGSPPFAGADRQSGRFPQLQAPAPSLAIIDPATPAPLAAVVEHLLAADPARRPASAADALAELEAAVPPGEEGTRPAWAQRSLAAAGTGA